MAKPKAHFMAKQTLLHAIAWLQTIRAFAFCLPIFVYPFAAGHHQSTCAVPFCTSIPFGAREMFLGLPSSSLHHCLTTPMCQPIKDAINSSSPVHHGLAGCWQVAQPSGPFFHAQTVCTVAGEYDK